MENIKQHPAWKGIYVQMPKEKYVTGMFFWDMAYIKNGIAVKPHPSSFFGLLAMPAGIERNPDGSPLKLKYEYEWKK